MILAFLLKESSVQVRLLRPASMITDEWQADRNNLLAKLDKFINDNNIKLTALEAIVMNYSPAPFSWSRTVTSMANALAWSLQIPIFKIKGELDDPVILAKTIKKTSAGKTKTSFIVPEYYKEPNIT
ncbi:MAG: hypothetical protein ACKKL5_01760 [Candidatus Komeilibacteria bacterium]